VILLRLRLKPPPMLGLRAGGAASGF